MDASRTTKASLRRTSSMDSMPRNGRSMCPAVASPDAPGDTAVDAPRPLARHHRRVSTTGATPSRTDRKRAEMAVAKRKMGASPRQWFGGDRSHLTTARRRSDSSEGASLLVIRLAPRRPLSRRSCRRRVGRAAAAANYLPRSAVDSYAARSPWPARAHCAK